MIACAVIVLATGYALLRLLGADAQTQVTVMSALFAVGVTAITYRIVERGRAGVAERPLPAPEEPELMGAGRG